MSLDMSREKINQIVRIAIWNRESGKKGIYVPGAADRIIAEVMACNPFRNVDHLADVIEASMVREEKRFGYDDLYFDSIALPGWQEWSHQMREAA